MRIALTYNEKRSADEAEAEFDTRATIDMLCARLGRLGHIVVPVEVSGSIERLIDRMMRLAPDVVFDIAEGTRGAFREAFYPALFEQLGFACTGSSPSTRALCLDKCMAERVVEAAGVDVPAGIVVHEIEELELHALEPPLIVKPNFEGSSKGINAASIVYDMTTLGAVVRACLDRYPDGALVEGFIEGKDVAVAWVDGLGWLPEIAYHFDAPIYDYALKHTAQERVRVEIPAALEDKVRERLQRSAYRAFEALGVSGYGRADFRITPRGQVVFLEMNTLPSLADGELFACTKAMGSSPEVMLACILRTARAVIREPCRRSA